MPGVQVVVVQRDGSAGSVGITDTSGEVTVDNVESGATIVAIYPEGQPVSFLQSFAAVQPGDHLTVGQGYYRTDAGGSAGTMTVTFPALPTAAYFLAYHPCTTSSAVGAGTTSITLDLFASCQTATASIELVAFDANSNIVRTGVLRDVAYTPGSTVSLVTWDPLRSFAVDVSGLTATVDRVDLVALSVLDGRANIIDIEGRFSVPVQSGAANATVQVVAGIDRIQAYVSEWRDNFGGHAAVAGLAPDATSATFLAPQLPWLGALTVNPNDQSVSWTQEAGASSGDGAVATANWYRVDPATGASHGYHWMLVLPPGITGWHWPAGPPELEPYVPVNGDPIDPSVNVLDFASAADYDAFRAIPTWVLQCPDCATKVGDASAFDTAASYLPPPL
jgi:hypothetical protein